MTTYLTLEDVAKATQVSEKTIRRLVNRGVLPFVRLSPRSMRFHPSAVEQALAQLQQPAQQPA